MRSIIKNHGLLAFCFLAFSMQAQEIIDTEATAKASEEVTKRTSGTTFKVDGVASVVGQFVILDSDIAQARESLKQQQVSATDLTECRILDKLMEDKLYAHHAIVDSIKISESQIRSYTQQQINYFMNQFGGSEERLLKFYRKESMSDLEKELFEINKNQELAKEMQMKIVEEVDVTPEEIRDYYRDLQKGELPVFGVELEISKILVEPEVSQEEKDKVIAELEGYRKDIVENGSSFATKAVLWSEDESSRGDGGLMRDVDRKSQFVKEFRDVAFSLQEGEVSKPFETEFGYHIIQVDKIKGQKIDLRHILRIPKLTSANEAAAKDEIEKIKKRIEDGELTFAEAAREFSDEKETASDGGILINPTTQDRMFELKNLPPDIYPKVQNLKEGEISMVYNNPTRTGRTRYEIYTVSQRIEEHEADFARDYVKIKNFALQAKRIKAVEKWQNEKIRETYVKINGDYRNCGYTSNWLKN